MDMKSGELLQVTVPVLWMTGLPGAGKTTTAQALRALFLTNGVKAMVLDGDVVRTGLCADLGFSDEDRIENVRRLAHVARLFQHEGYVVIVATISPLKAQRDLARAVVGNGFCETYISTPLEICRQRDPKGMYARAQQWQMTQFTGVSGTYEAPAQPDIVIDTAHCEIEASIGALLAQLRRVAELPTGF